MGLLTLSLAAHGAVIVSMVMAGLRSTSFPEHAPKEMAYPLFAVPVSIPPALGTPHAPRHQIPASAPKDRAALSPYQPLAPQTLPENVQPMTPSAPGTGDATPTSTSSGEGRGTPWGSENGVGAEGPPAATVQEGPLPVTGEVKAPIVIRRVQPVYPRVALMGRMNGTVVVQCIIDRSGQVRDARVVRSTFAAFDQPAIDAVRQWLFIPGTLHSKSVDTIFELTVSFRVTS